MLNSYYSTMLSRIMKSRTERRRSNSPYMDGRLAWHAGEDPTPPGDLAGDDEREWRRGYRDARKFYLARRTQTR